jgi:hypothetical protein
VWTIDELVERVGAALAGTYPGVSSGRVRDVPDRRAIRWYATTGLVDRPIAMRGRVALYGPRHLLQLVAIKRRQADGRSLAEIQVELAGASDATLTGIAGVPEELLTVDGPQSTMPSTRPRFWAAAPPTSVAPVSAAPLPAASVFAAPRSVAPMSGVPVPLPARSDRMRTLGAIVLGGGAVLLLPGQPDPVDLDAISDAARALLAELAARGLLDDVAVPAGRPRRDDMYPPDTLHVEYEAPRPAGHGQLTHHDQPARPDNAEIHGVRTERSPS